MALKKEADTCRIHFAFTSLKFWFVNSACCIPLSTVSTIYRDTIDAVKQSAALTLLRLLRSSPDIIPMGEWTSRIIHLLNDQHMV